MLKVEWTFSSDNAFFSVISNDGGDLAAISGNMGAQLDRFSASIARNWGYYRITRQRTLETRVYEVCGNEGLEDYLEDLGKRQARIYAGIKARKLREGIRNAVLA
jgi:hypothetical protein